MKVFISHSSTDKWIARRISEDLLSRGIQTFLDEKDIKTGESIDDSIQHHLADCDELLMLLSPAALRSTWVLIEIGGAKALRKRLIPITNHVPANELPTVLSGGLARDLNDIDIYYREVEERMKSGSNAGERYDIGRILPRKVESRSGDWVPVVGQQVTVVSSRPDPESLAVSVVGWLDDMNRYLGQSATVTDVTEDDAFHLLRIDIDSDKWWWASEWLLPDIERTTSDLDELLRALREANTEPPPNS